MYRILKHVLRYKIWNDQMIKRQTKCQTKDELFDFLYTNFFLIFVNEIGKFEKFIKYYNLEDVSNTLSIRIKKNNHNK